MRQKTLSEIKREASDRFSYILVFCPNFPPATKATTKTAFEKLINLIDVLMNSQKDGESKQWLRVCLQEVRQSWKHYEEGDLKGGSQIIQRAEEKFDNAFSKKPIKARFVSGESGLPLDSDEGFPE